MNLNEAVSLAKSALNLSDTEEIEIITEQHTFTRIVVEERINGKQE
jgi:hypothetical protein